jgi:hypothetical protein
MSSNGKSFLPIFNGHACMEKETANAVVQCPNDSLCLSVLRRSIRTGETEDNAMMFTVPTQSNVVKLLAIVSLQGKQGQLKLGLNISVKGK